MTPVRLEPAALQSRVKHSTTEPLRSLFVGQYRFLPKLHGGISSNLIVMILVWSFKFFKDLYSLHEHTGQCKSTGGCYNELVVAYFGTGGGVKWRKR